MGRAMMGKPMDRSYRSLVWKMVGIRPQVREQGPRRVIAGGREGQGSLPGGQQMLGIAKFLLSSDILPPAFLYQYARKAVPHLQKMDKYRLIRYPLTTGR